VIEDVLTTGGAAIAAIEKVRAAGAQVIGLVAVLDREEGAAENLARLEVPFTALFTTRDLTASASSADPAAGA
jgi:orotate phosphoribosyltransferase